MLKNQKCKMLYIYSLISIQILKPKNKKSITMKQNDLQMQKKCLLCLKKFVGMVIQASWWQQLGCFGGTVSFCY